MSTKRGSVHLEGISDIGLVPIIEDNQDIDLLETPFGDKITDIKNIQHHRKKKECNSTEVLIQEDRFGVSFDLID